MSIITIKQIARDLGLSIATISKALRDGHDIGEETKKRVRAYALSVNYTPNPYASSLRKRKSKTIAVVLPEVTDSFFSKAINGIEVVAQMKGYHVLIYLSHESLLREQSILKDFQSGRVDGVLMSITTETECNSHIQELHARGIPIVFFDRVCNEIDTAKITTNDFESGYAVTSHLLESGCNKIGFLTISNCLPICMKRSAGYKKALIDHHMESKESDMILCSNNEEENYTLIKKILSQKKRPNGIIASVEKLSTTIYQVCKDIGLQIPNDIKVVCFSNQSTAAILNPSLTTVTQPAFEMGKTAAALLFKALEKTNLDLTKESVIIPSTLHIRESSVLAGISKTKNKLLQKEILIS